MTKGALEGLYFCLEILIPSLFPFMVLSSFTVFSGAAAIISRPFNIITNKVFKLPTIAGSTILLSLFGGYPVGAIGVNSLLEQGYISAKDGKRLVYFAFCGGPAFAVFVVGQQLYNNVMIGIIIYVSQIISTLLIGFIISIKYKPPKKSNNEKYIHKPLSISGALVTSCNECSISILKLCGLVVAFSAFLGLMNSCGLLKALENFLTWINVSSGVAKGLVPAFFEVTKGSYTLVKNGASIAIVAGAVGFGGLSVHFQVFSAIKNLEISKIKFMLCRLASAILSSVFTYICMLFYSPVLNVFSSTDSSFKGGTSTTIIGSCALLFMSICFVLTTYKQNN